MVGFLLVLAGFLALNAPVSVTTTIPYQSTYVYQETMVTTDPFLGPYTFTNLVPAVGYGVSTSTTGEPFYQAAMNPTVQQPYACRYLALNGAIVYCAIEYARIMFTSVILLLILVVYVLVASRRKPAQKQKTLEDFAHD